VDFASNFRFHAVKNCLPKVGVEATLAPVFKTVQVAESLEHRILNDVLRICDISQALWKPAAGPTFQGRSVSSEQFVNRLLIASGCALKQTLSCRITRNIHGRSK